MVFLSFAGGAGLPLRAATCGFSEADLAEAVFDAAFPGDVARACRFDPNAARSDILAKSALPLAGLRL